MRLSAIVLLLVAQPTFAWAVDGVSVTAHFEGSVDWTFGGYGSIWRHDIENSEVVARRELHDGPGRMAVMSHDCGHVAFVRQGSAGALTVMNIGGGSPRVVANAHEQAALDWPDDDTVYYNFGSWYSTNGSRNIWRVNIDSGASEQAVQFNDGIWRFHVANDEVRMVARPTEGPAYGTITTYELPGDGSFDPANSTDSPSCGSAIGPLGEYFLDGMNAHQGFDVRNWETLEIVQSFIHADVAALWGGPDSGTDHNRNGWSVNSEDWICGHIGWDISPYVNHFEGGRGGNQVLYNWRAGSEERIVVTPNLEDSHAYDSAGDFWVGAPPVPAARGMRAYWLFDAGMLGYDGVGSHTLLNEGVTSTVGVEHEAAELVASEGDRLRITDGALASGTPWKLADGRPEMTVAGWFKKDRAGELEYLLQKGVHSFGLFISPGSGNDDFCVELARYPHNDSAPSAQATHLCWQDTVAIDTWMFFAVTLDAARELRVRLWDHGAATWLTPDATWTLTEPPIFTGGDLVIGCGTWDGSDHCFDGALDGLRLYDHSMSATEIAGLIAPADCLGEGGVCCAAGDICSSVQAGSGCGAGAVCCGSLACAPPACGDGICSAGESCDLDSCCDGQPVDGVTAVCCFGVFTPGECCNNADCTPPATCADQVCVTPTLPPLAHWAMNADGLTQDTAGDNTLLNDGVIASAGRRGGGAAFSGDQALSITDAELGAGMPLKSDGGATAFTFAGWLHRNGNADFEYVLQKGGQTEGKLSLGVYVSSGGALCAGFGLPGGDDAADYVCSLGQLQTLRWYFFAVSLSDGGDVHVRVWDDDAGVWLSSAAGVLSNALNVEDGALRLGNGEWGGSEHGFNGTLDEVRIYNYAMSPEQLDELRVRDASGPNVAPAVHAGEDQLDVTGSTVLGIDAAISDANGDALTLAWTQVAGPATAELATPTELVTVVTFARSGVYTFRLTADDGELQASDEVAITVTALPNIQLIRPAGGEVLGVGQTALIEWVADRVNDVAIRYSTDDGVSWNLIAGSVDEQSPHWQRYPWTVPNQPSSRCRVRLEGYFDANNAAVSELFEIRVVSVDYGEPPSGCDCAGAGAPSLLLLLALVRRRRGSARLTSAPG